MPDLEKLTEKLQAVNVDVRTPNDLKGGELHKMMDDPAFRESMAKFIQGWMERHAPNA